MCGLFGVSYGPAGPSAELWTPEELMQLMYPAIVHRGKDAWGYMYHTPGSDTIDWFKKPGTCIHPKAMQDMTLPEGPMDWFVGHVRAATRGLPHLNVNNHPLTHGDIVGVHNGTLIDWQRIIDQTGRQQAKATVDSEAIFAAVNKWGPVQGMQKIRGAAVTIFADTSKPERLYIARTDRRPLWTATTAAGSFIWASEPQVITGLGLDLKDDPAEFTYTNRIFSVEHGEVKTSTQFRKPEPKPKVTTRASDPVFHHSLYEPPSGSGSTQMFQEDKYGGTYIGMNRWRVKSGSKVLFMNAQEYLDYVLKIKQAAFDREVDLRVQAETQRRLQALTTYLDGKTASSQPAPGELELIS